MKLRRVVTFAKYFTSVTPLIILPKTFTWNEIALLASNLLNFLELVVNELKKKNIYQKYLQKYLGVENLRNLRKGVLVENSLKIQMTFLLFVKLCTVQTSKQVKVYL